MPAKRAAEDGGGGAGKKSRRALLIGSLQQKTAAEFFAENKHFAGFESPGKSLYTSIRELVENSLDAAESIGVLPEIHILLEEISHTTFRKMHGMDTAEKAGAKDSKGKLSAPQKATANDQAGAKAPKGKASAPKKVAAKDKTFFRLTITDNGCGMRHEEIPKMFGTVLSGTKYGVRQERGKFGLGSKMVLIWSKMSTGLPMQIRSSQGTSKPVSIIRSSQGTSKPVSVVRLDLDLHSNSPNVHKHDKEENVDKWRGSQENVDKHDTEDHIDTWRGFQIKVTIAGEFSKFKRYTVNYLREMAVITPYARFEMHYVAEDVSKSFHIIHSRRSENMPPPPSKAKVHSASLDNSVMDNLINGTSVHPASLDNSVMDNLISGTSQKTLVRFLTAELDGVDTKLARKMVDEFGQDFSYEMDVAALDISKIRRMVDKIQPLDFAPPSGALLSPAGEYNLHPRSVDKIQQLDFAPPSGALLSPAGEYNLHLGVMKEMRPDMIATSTPDATVVDGHAVKVEAAVSLGGRKAKEGIQGVKVQAAVSLGGRKAKEGVQVEAAVSLGGRKAKEGIQVHRFANRIPMLFQQGNDVSVKTAMTRINWKSYRIDKHQHKVGVFVSICSTKIPYGGPNKEYIGDENEELQRAVRDAIMKCCIQL
ncbi:topoisomerase VI B subunit, transducer-domain-containing protein, partial [Baffinella frigidus]